MKKTRRTHVSRSSNKAATGISGFDEITRGGLPRARTTLIVGGAGSGKTVFSLHFLVHGARACGEAGIFVAFEESAERIAINARSFGWKLESLTASELTFIDAQPDADVARSGDFDFEGLCAVLDAAIKRTNARRIVFDALDVVLALLPDAAARRRELYRIHTWLLTRELSGVMTFKSGGDKNASIGEQPFGFLQFMVDCAVILNHSVVLGVSQRNLRVQKYRGSGFDENEFPFLIGRSGFELAIIRPLAVGDALLSSERVSAGVERLDTMLNGGYFRGAAVQITGFSGTAKTTLAGCFAEAACKRGERTLFVSFDSDARELSRNLASVGIHLDTHCESGLLHVVSARSIVGSAETCLVRIKALAVDHKAVCVVVDPVSSWARSVNDLTAPTVGERLIDWSKAHGVTLLFTRLFDEVSSSTSVDSHLQVSTLADTWIHLTYSLQAGERNRGLSIIKSRGTAHSNQVRELLLSDEGVTLADAYTAGGDVLMGTQRWQKERSERYEAESADVNRDLKRVRLDAEEAELAVRLNSLKVELQAKKVEKTLLVRTSNARRGERMRERNRIGELRGGDEPQKRGRRKQ